MSATAVSLWLLNSVLAVSGQLAFKAAARDSCSSAGLAGWLDMARRQWIWLGIVCYVFEFLLWIAFLSLVPLSVGMLLACINTVAIALGGRIFFAERLTPMRLLSTMLIVAGVAAVGMN